MVQSRPRTQDLLTLAVWMAFTFAAVHSVGGTAVAAAPGPSGIKAKAALVMDARTGKVLWSRRAEEPRAIASTTKILTALTAKEAGDLGREVSVEATPPIYDGTIGLAPGDKLTRRELLYAMLMKSANDAAYVLAEDVGGSQQAFARSMNRVAEQVGPVDGVFMRNPHGLPDDQHTGTALAVAYWSRALLRDPELAPIVATKRTRLGRFGQIGNTNWLLWMDPTVTGVKTGFTNAAGYCLSASNEKPDRSLIAVVLGSPTESSRFQDAKRLLQWGDAQYRRRPVVTTKTAYATPKLPEWGDRRVRVVAAAEASATVLAGSPLDKEVVAPKVLDAPVHEGQEVGFIRVSQDGMLLATVPLVAAESVPAPSLWDRIRLWWGSLRAVHTGPVMAEADEVQRLSPMLQSV